MVGDHERASERTRRLQVTGGPLPYPAPPPQTFKWGITIANIADFKRPAENVSYPQQVAVTATGLIWSRFSTQITPVGGWAEGICD